MTLNETDWEIIFSPVLQIIKKHLRVTKSFPTAAIFHEGMTGIDSPWQQSCANLISFFIQLVNGNNITSVSTLLRLHQAQLKQLMTYLIWDLTRQDIVHMKTGSKSNLALHSLIIACSMEIHF